MSTETKREDYLSWDDYFMAVAFLSAQRSKDPKVQLGACIVSPENKIVGIGYNGMPNGCDDNKLPWTDGEEALAKKDLYVCPAELNAILNKNSASVSGCTMYVAQFPTNEMAKLVIQSGITRVLFMSDDSHDEVPFVAARRLFDMAGVSYKQYLPTKQTITIDFGALATASAPVTKTPEKAPTPIPTPTKTPTPTPTEAPTPTETNAQPTVTPTTTAGTPSKAEGEESNPEPHTPNAEASSSSHAWYVPVTVTQQQTQQYVSEANNGDFLIRESENGDRVLIVKDDTVVRAYTMKPDPEGQGRWVFGQKTYPSIRTIVTLLRRTPIKSKTGKMITLGQAAKGGVELEEAEPIAPVASTLPQTPGGTVAADDESCSIM